MRALTFWKTVTVDQANFLESLISLLAEHGVRCCVIGGLLEAYPKLRSQVPAEILARLL